MNKWREWWLKINRRLSFAYGLDQLNYFLIWCYFAVGLLIIFTPRFSFKYLFYLIGVVLILIVLLRSYSKDTYKRQMENSLFMGLWYKIKHKFKHSESHVVITCPYCQQKLRVKRTNKTLVVKCAQCGKQFEYKKR